ncbi:hypothetical protein [Clostridium sp.]|uniref:hypothetical protein n=1 Tax=Clostridium sp. TaxID=1506 RepID=UPI003F38B474
MRKKISKKALKMTRKERLKLRRRKFFTSCAVFLASVIALSTLVYFLVINTKLKDLNYAIKYYFTSSNLKDERLLEVQEFDLEFNDGEKAVITAYGLTHEKPHLITNVKANLNKNEKGKWTLDKTSLVSYKN